MKSAASYSAAIGLAALAGHASAMQAYLDYLPNGSLFSQELGHPDNDSTQYTDFATAFEAVGLSWTAAFCADTFPNSDMTNGAAFGDPCCTWAQGDTPDFTVTAFTTDPTTATVCASSSSATTSATTSSAATSTAASTAASSTTDTSAATSTASSAATAATSTAASSTTDASATSTAASSTTDTSTETTAPTAASTTSSATSDTSSTTTTAPSTGGGGCRAKTSSRKTGLRA